MNPFQIEIKEIITHLQECYSKIEKVQNPEMLLLRNSILQDLKRKIDMLKLQVGIEPDSDLAPIVDPHAGPIKRLFGKDVTAPGNRPVDVNKPFQQTPDDVMFQEQKLKADELYPRILATPSDHLLDSVPDDIMRVIAKRAGLPVTETNPARITTTYIDQIKEAMRQKNSGNESINLSDVPTSNFSLYDEFISLDSKDIIETYTDPQIRDVARKAGLPVTDKTPVKIDKKFIDQIKAAIKKQEELNAIAGNV